MGSSNPDFKRKGVILRKGDEAQARTKKGECGTVGRLKLTELVKTLTGHSKIVGFATRHSKIVLLADGLCEHHYIISTQVKKDKDKCPASNYYEIQT
ncbi:hypothetical protein OsI_23269 [Oryza sativa Indica Group]|uniref:Uncharacterized protein n=1 Tax=Oryza sativa subsp. indica TaxID=39946 RepID=B8B3D0_ORYSI|nr:hypothetical protein OsI_23269 [Oryza sativa Indica Group]